ncbi:hypothetical protein FACUT_14015 [Fusarium acutatum]|uniref:C2H2-type domain-containing protein n=1 Tax=Fusarium acutatum TaxID=78861 RepID=A0A8H4NHB7_9HYPO|nr:hypothetical protein FACUT_14015 [Fusarium acutatum]
MEKNPLSCDHCGERFQRREHRDRHVLRHTGLKPFQCNICSKSFSRRSMTLWLVIEHCMVILGRPEHVVAGVVKLVYLVQSRSRAVMEVILARDSSQDIAASSPLTGHGADFQEEAFIPHDLNCTSEEWDNPPSIPSDIIGMPTMASSTIHTTAPDTSSSWPHVPTLPDTFTLNGDIDSFGNMTANPWMPWNSSIAHFSFPWFMDELEMPLELSDMAQPREDIPCHPFPEPEAIGMQMAGAEIFGHIHKIPRHAVDALNKFYKTQRRDSTPTAIPQDILQAFVELYFEYFDSQFPFLHPSRLEDPGLPSILLLAVAAVGSHYSEIQGAEDYNTALCDLLARAIELPCVFLLHVLWLFSGSQRDKIVLQHKRSSLATMCWDLIGKADKRRNSSQTELDTEQAWQAWITEESGIRLVTCVRVLESLSHIFLGTPLVFNPREATRQLPCPETLWQSRDASEWKSAQENSTGNQPKPDSFAAKVILLELYIDDRNYYRQLRTSQLLQSSFAPYLNSSANSDTQDAPNPTFHRPDISRSESTLLDTTIDGLTLKNIPNPGECTETIFQVIAILRLIPLETLHSATGWETNKEQMLKSKMHLNDFFMNSGVKARKGLWHATCIFKTTRSSRRLACYDALSLTVAMGYIYCYSETRTSLAETSARPVITRLDQLQDREAIEQWIENGGDNVVHLTGVGLLDGSDHCVRFLRVLERTLVSQIAWRGFCRAFASSFAQLRRGETPTKSSREYNNAE